MTTSVGAHPFLKWAGGKRILVPEINQRLPRCIRRYWEPFLGGGAVFFAIRHCVDTACLSDINKELMCTYRAVRDYVDALCDELQIHVDNHSDESYYMQVREHESHEPIAKAARFIYLNRTCFNGLYRVNNSGKFNVPRGDYKKPKILDTENLHRVSDMLQGVDLTYGSFTKIEPELNDFVYCDPPYDGTYTAYAPHGFDADDQRDLRDSVLLWVRQGAQVMLSNADTPLIRSLYGRHPFRIHDVVAPRRINSNGSDRGNVRELIITTYRT